MDFIWPLCYTISSVQFNGHDLACYISIEHIKLNFNHHKLSTYYPGIVDVENIPSAIFISTVIFLMLKFSLAPVVFECY